MIGLAVLAASTALAAAEPRPADALPPTLMTECDAAAAPIERAEPAIAASVAALTAIGAFTTEEFRGARIGFCPLRREGGPVGATSCKNDIILLDEKYRSADEALVLQATLAHEMIHVLQHRKRRAVAGDAYCDSASYVADKAALEAAADKFGDAAAALIALGRSIEIVNDCHAPVLIYLEADDSVAAARGEPRFQRIEAHASKLSPVRAASGDMRFAARTAPPSGSAHVWETPKGRDTRVVEGRLLRLRETRLAARDRLKSPFRLRLTCASGKGG